MSKKVLLTGGAGFIGHHLAKHLFSHTDWNLTFMDRLDGSGNMNRLVEAGFFGDSGRRNGRWRFVYHNLRASINDQLVRQLGEFDYILHLAAATHVDRSISEPMEFVQDNVVATCNLLDFARQTGCEKFLQFSTDEVFGPAPPGVRYKEDDRFYCSNPYSATKAGSEELARSYYLSLGVPVVVSHTMNVCGVRQHPEKFIPGTISKILKGEKVVIHANKDAGTAGTRFYIDAADVADAVHFLMAAGVPGQKYNVVGKQEVDNLTLAKWIHEDLWPCIPDGVPLDYELIDGARPGARPGHDLRYALDGSKMAAMGWEPHIDIRGSVKQIVQWSMQNPRWLR
jgi:dTDP-glucose 4,6-dehydratase